LGKFGEKFRKERERRGFTLDDVSNVTKIGSRMLKAIEEDRFEALPGGVFNKGFIRAYAKHLGLNDEEAISDYLAALREAQIGAQLAEDQPEPGAPSPAGQQARNSPPKGPRGKKAKSTSRTEEQPELAEAMAARRSRNNNDNSGIPWKALLLAVAVLLILAMALWGLRSHNVRTGQDRPEQPPSSQKTAADAVPAEAFVAPSSSTPTGVATASKASTPLPAAKAPSTASVAAPVVGAKSGKPPEESKVPGASAEKPLAEPAKAAVPFMLVIRATENSWISVTADGQAVGHETLIAPAHTSVRGNREIVVKAGNAAGVSFLLNGKEIPPQGAEGEVKTFIFDSTGIQSVTPGQTSDNSSNH
jgi:cytoskeleton protein RodZ